MKKLLACLMGALLLVGVAVTPVQSIYIISEKPVIVLVDTFYTSDVAELITATQDVASGDMLKIYSQGPGGNAFVCISMMNYIDSLKSKGVYVETESLGLAASANGFLWLMGDKRVVNRGDLLMFHEVIPRDTYGNPVKVSSLPPDAQLVINHLNHWIRQRLLDLLGDTEMVNDMLDDENNWYTAEELFDMGVATNIQ